MAQFPGYLRPSAPAAAACRPGSLLDIVGALGPREPSSATPAGGRGPVPHAVVAAATGPSRGVAAPGRG